MKKKLLIGVFIGMFILAVFIAGCQDTSVQQPADDTSTDDTVDMADDADMDSEKRHIRSCYISCLLGFHVSN